jgi:uncharacterized protein YceK
MNCAGDNASMSEPRTHRRRIAGLLCLAAQLTGCGTMLMTTSLSATGDSPLRNGCNVLRYSPCQRISHVYGGAMYDGCTVASLFTAAPSALRNDPVPAVLYAPAYLGFVVLTAVDFPLSAVADTFALPWSTERQAKGDACPEGWTVIPPYERNVPKPDQG